MRTAKVMEPGGAVRRPRSVGGFVALVLALAACGSGTGGAARHAGIPGVQNGMDVRRPAAPGGQTPARGARAVPGARSEDGPGAAGPPAAIVPDVRGMVFPDAVHRLWRSGIDYALVFAREGPGRVWSVVQEDPAPGTNTPGSGAVNLVLAMPHMHGAGPNGTVRCKPETDELDDPYCLGKLFKYS